MSEIIKVEHLTNHIVEVLINRPENYNTFNTELRLSLAENLRKIDQINSLISDSIGKLQSIKNIQDQMQDTEAWLTKSNEERQHINEKLKEGMVA